MDYKLKYLKYKKKYLDLKTQIGGQKFPNAGVSGKRVIINRNRVGKIISSSVLADGTNTYTVEYTDTHPRTQERNISEQNIINFPKNIRTLVQDTYVFLKPGTKIRYTVGPVTKEGFIKGIRDMDDEFYKCGLSSDKHTFLDDLTVPRSDITVIP
jgi:hypothetical protein